MMLGVLAIGQGIRGLFHFSVPLLLASSAWGEMQMTRFNYHTGLNINTTFSTSQILQILLDKEVRQEPEQNMNTCNICWLWSSLQTIKRHILIIKSIWKTQRISKT